MRKGAERAEGDRKTARRYVRAAKAEGLTQEAGARGSATSWSAPSWRRSGPDGRTGTAPPGSSWFSEEQITAWVKGSDSQEPLSIVKIEELLARQGCVVAYGTLHRFAVERAGSGEVDHGAAADGEPSVECKIDFAQMGFIVDPEIGKKRRVHALIFTAVVSRHMFVWLTYSQTLSAVIAGCDAAWDFFDGVFKVLISGQP